MRRAAVVLSFLFAAGCLSETELVPAPWVPTAAGRADIATETVSGVQLQVGGDMWHGDPSDLPSLVTPVWVSIVNQSGHALRVRYRELDLEGQSGFHYAALPPFSVQGSAVSAAPSSGPAILLAAEVHPVPPAPTPPAAREPPSVAAPEPVPRPIPPAPPRVVPSFRGEGFLVAPRYQSFYALASPSWPYPFDYDWPYYDAWYGSWPRALPTQDMLQKALPEGVLENAGSVSGFVYFQGVTGREKQVTFHMSLMDANSAQPFGHASIPLLARRESH